MQETARERKQVTRARVKEGPDQPPVQTCFSWKGSRGVQRRGVSLLASTQARRSVQDEDRVENRSRVNMEYDTGNIVPTILACMFQLDAAAFLPECASFVLAWSGVSVLLLSCPCWAVSCSHPLQGSCARWLKSSVARAKLRFSARFACLHEFLPLEQNERRK